MFPSIVSLQISKLMYATRDNLCKTSRQKESSSYVLHAWKIRILSTDAVYTYCHLSGDSPGWYETPVSPQLPWLLWLLQDSHCARCLSALCWRTPCSPRRYAHHQICRPRSRKRQSFSSSSWIPACPFSTLFNIISSWLSAMLTLNSNIKNKTTAS